MAKHRSGEQVKIEPSQGDGWKISTPHGYIDYRHVSDGDGDVNEIWWVESHQRGHGSDLVDLMQKHHPALAVAWGATSQSGDALRKRWHKKHPQISCIDSGPFEGQFDPFGHDDVDDLDDDLDEDLG